MGLRRGAAAWGRAGAQQRGAVQGRSIVGLRRGAAVWAAQVRSSVGLRRGAAARAVQGRSSVGLRRGAAWGCAWAQQHRAAHGHSSVERGWLLGVASGEWEDGGGRATGV